MSVLFGVDDHFFEVRGIPHCWLCTLDLLAKPHMREVFPVTTDHSWARAYFAFLHISHGRVLHEFLY